MKRWLKIFLILCLIVLVVIVGHIYYKGFMVYYKSNNQTNLECITDSDCSKAGCSGQLCANAKDAINIVTTCEWKEEYSCYKDISCSCISGKCSWSDQEQLSKCLQKFS